MDRQILVNKAQCNGCSDTIESRYRHDFNSCICGKLSVDGGKDYVRRVFDSDIGYQELTEYAPKTT